MFEVAPKIANTQQLKLLMFFLTKIPTKQSVNVYSSWVIQYNLLNLDTYIHKVNMAMYGAAKAILDVL
jgi:hypothetical protein